MRFDVLTLFPDLFSGYLDASLLKRAIDRSLVEVALHDIRQWSADRHRKVDDRPFGGGPGMVLKVDVIVPCVEQIQRSHDTPGHLVMLTPQGRRLSQAVVEELAGHKRLLLLCGRYEGFDERVRLILQPDEISLGDFVLNGGEVAAMAIVDSVIRLVPGVLGDEESSGNDSFSGDERRLEYAQYTRPRHYRGWQVPDVLLSGDHAAVARWREADSRLRTTLRRSDSGEASPSGEGPGPDEPLRELNTEPEGDQEPPLAY